MLIELFIALLALRCCNYDGGYVDGVVYSIVGMVLL